jgi:hypothetical protein
LSIKIWERPCIPFDFIGDKPQGRIISFLHSHFIIS